MVSKGSIDATEGPGAAVLSMHAPVEVSLAEFEMPYVFAHALSMN